MAPLSHFSPRKLLLWPSSRFLAINGVLAAFVLVAHGGALLVSAQQAHPDAEEIRRLAQLSVPLSALVISGSLLAWLRPSVKAIVLRVQAIAGLLLALYLALWAVQLLLGSELPPHFVWTPGFLTAIVYYVAVLFTAHLAGARLPDDRRYLIPGLAALVAAALDVSVLIKALQ
jgi:hypothetical protein